MCSSWEAPGAVRHEPETRIRTSTVPLMTAPRRMTPAPQPQPVSFSLGGTWRAVPADDVLRRSYPEPGFDDRDWEPLAVPGHWSSSPAFAGTDGPLLHRHHFTTPDGMREPGTRTWLVLDGVFQTSDVWLDGTYVGDTEGYFFPHAFEVTDALAARDEHTLAVEVSCTPRGLLGAFAEVPGTPGGIWRPVRLERTGPVRITHLRVRCTDVTDEVATIAVRAVLDSAEATAVELRTTIEPARPETPDAGPSDRVDDHQTRPLARGENRVEWTVAVPNPRRWWPRALGDQPLYDLSVSVVPGGEVSDRRHRRLGLRTVSVNDWVFRVNGERLFLKGAAQGPTGVLPGEASASDVAADIDLALAAGLDLLRLRAHVARPELYDAADAAGLLLWQDMPLRGPAHRSIRREARRQALELVDLLAHHPSVLVWCAHDEPEPLDVARTRSSRWGTGNRLAARTVAAHQLPSWSRTILDRSVRSVLGGSDGSRPVIPHAGVLPHAPWLSGTDAHLSFGWYHHEAGDLGAALAVWPRLARFVGGFGSASVPDDADFLHPGRWPDLDWEEAAERFGLEKDVFDRVVPPAAHESFEAWRAATQQYQAELVRRQVETLRRLRFRPCGGFTVAAFADPSPAVSPAVLDHRRRPKPAYRALAAACAPVAVVADPLPAVLRRNEAFALDIHVINDRRITLGDMIAVAYLRWEGSARPAPPSPSGSTTTSHRWRWRGDVPPDDCIRIGTLQAVAPDTPGPLVLDLRLSPAAEPATVVAGNTYRAQVQ